LNFIGDLGGFFQQTGDVEFQILKSYKIPEVWIHLASSS
jgi:hypothetical protein